MPDKKEKLKQALLSGKVKDETTLSVFAMVEDLKDELETLKQQVDEAVNKVEESKLDLPAVLENVKGKDSKPEDVASILKNDSQFKEEIKGEKGDSIKGDDYVLTEKDKKEIASKIEVPVIEKIVETIVEKQPIVTNEIKEVAVADSAEDIRNKLELLDGDERLKIEAIKNLRDELDELKARKGGIIGGGNVGRDIIKRYDISDQLNGTLKVFSLPAFWSILSVSLSSYPYGAMQNTNDYTFDQNASTITFTSGIDESTQLASGQKCIIIYVG